MKHLREILTISAMIVFIIAFGFGTQAHAQRTFRAVLDGLQETPPVTTTTATGTGTVVLNAAETHISLTMNFSGLGSNQIASHIHSPAPRGVAAGVIINIGSSGTTSGSFALNNVAVSAAEVANLKNGLWYFNVHSQGFPGGEIRGQVEPDCATSAVGMVSWWPADGNALDVRSRNNGTLQNGATFAAGYSGPAFSFDGADDYVDTSNAPSLTPPNQMTIEAWVNPLVLSGGRRIVDKITPAGSDGYVLQINNGRLNFIVGSLNLIGPTSLAANTWVHVAGTYDGARLRIYLNGALEGELMGASPIPPNGLNLRIGADSAGGSNFNGLIDEPSMYDRALSTSEIAAIHLAGTAGKCKPAATVSPADQIGWWAGDGDANDIAGGNNGSLQNGAAFAVSRVGQGFMFDGFDDYVDIPDSPALEVSTQLTLEAWIRPTDVGNFRQIISKFGISGNYSYQFGLAPGGALRTDLSQTGGPNYEQLSSPNGVITVNAWHHVAATFNGGATVLYVDGVQVASGTLPITSIFSAGNTNVNLGRDPANTQHFLGSIDEASIYSRALTSSEIQSIFNAGIAGKLKETLTTGTTAAVGDVTVTYSGPAVRRTHQIPLEHSDMPPLPTGMTPTGLLYDIATDAIPSGSTGLCFNLPAFAALSNTEFLERRILHLEAGSWVNRTTSWSFSTKTICAQVPSLSPFAIVDSNLAPTAANVSVGGRVMTAGGQGISGTRVSITDDTGETRAAITNAFGYYRFDGVEVGRTYVIGVRSKQHQFETPIRTISVLDELADVDFVALSKGLRLRTSKSLLLR